MHTYGFGIINKVEAAVIVILLDDFPVDVNTFEVIIPTSPKVPKEHVFTTPPNRVTGNIEFGKFRQTRQSITYNRRKGH
jgi:hypothetical protein